MSRMKISVGRLQDRLKGDRLLGVLVRRGPLILFGLLLVGLAWRAPNLLSPSSIESSLIQASPIAIVGFGLALVVIGGGDDVVVGGIDAALRLGLREGDGLGGWRRRADEAAIRRYARVWVLR